MFKAGMRVVRRDNKEITDIVKAVPGDWEYDRKDFYDPEKGFTLWRYSWERMEYWKPLGVYDNEEPIC